jgi:hypothetical protein
MDIIHCPVLFQTHNDSWEMGPSSIDWTQLSRLDLKTETKSSLQNVVF